MDRIIIRSDLTTPYQHLYVYKNGEKVDTIGVLFEDLVETTLTSLEKYELTVVDLSGPRMYMQGIEKNIKEAIATKYNFPEITFKYV
jgi:hypothetical protein